MKSKSIYHSCQYRKQLNFIGKYPNSDLIMPNEMIRHFIVFIEAEEVTRLGIPVEITLSERVKMSRAYNQKWRRLGCFRKRPLGRPRSRREDNVRMDLQEIGVSARNSVDSAQDGDYWRELDLCSIEPLDFIRHGVSW